MLEREGVELSRIGELAQQRAENSQKTKPRVYYISGHLNLKTQAFRNHYFGPIKTALSKWGRFVVGDAPGCDEMFQRLMRDAGLSHRVTVYHMLEKPRRWVQALEGENSKLVGGFKTDEGRDTAMTWDSDEDIAWVRSGRESSGTAQNLLRRKQG